MSSPVADTSPFETNHAKVEPAERATAATSAHAAPTIFFVAFIFIFSFLFKKLFFCGLCPFNKSLCRLVTYKVHTHFHFFTQNRVLTIFVPTFKPNTKSKFFNLPRFHSSIAVIARPVY
ncbi:MAG: 4Fe-4S binding protein [Clostridia bacterium]|nr:4Fe-4S binding protein [Clostridia bacterium]